MGSLRVSVLLLVALGVGVLSNPHTWAQPLALAEPTVIIPATRQLPAYPEPPTPTETPLPRPQLTPAPFPSATPTPAFDADLPANADLSLSLAAPTLVHRGDAVRLRAFVQALDKPVRGVTLLVVFPSAYFLAKGGEEQAEPSYALRSLGFYDKQGKVLPAPNWACHAFNVGTSYPVQPVRLYCERTGWLMPGQVEEIRMDLELTTSALDRYSTAIQMALLGLGVDYTAARVMYTPGVY